MADRDPLPGVSHRGAMRTPFSHAADDHFQFLGDYLRHLVDLHGVEETPELWRQGREEFDRLHAEGHGEHSDDSEVPDGEG